MYLRWQLIRSYHYIMRKGCRWPDFPCGNECITLNTFEIYTALYVLIIIVLLTYMLSSSSNMPPQMSLCLYIPSSFPGELNYLSCHHPCSSPWFVNRWGHWNCHWTSGSGCCCCYHCGCGAGCDTQKTWSREKILVS